MPAPAGRTGVAPFFVILVGPVALAALLLGALNWSSFRSIHLLHQSALAEQAEDLEAIATATRFNREIADIQREVGMLLEEAAAGRIGQEGAYRFHAALVNRLAALDAKVGLLKDVDGEVGEVRHQLEGLAQVFAGKQSRGELPADAALVAELDRLEAARCRA